MISYVFLNANSVFQLLKKYIEDRQFGFEEWRGGMRAAVLLHMTARWYHDHDVQLL